MPSNNLGKRGMGISRASAYTAYSGTSAPEYIKFANDNTLVIIQFEDEKLLPQFPAMCAVDGVDACIIGPRDLSLNMGFPDGPNHHEVQTVIDQAIAIMKNANIPQVSPQGHEPTPPNKSHVEPTLILAASQS
jgi:2-keto-3-deoxy-L-rhamnonate aldolase RhmA